MIAVIAIQAISGSQPNKPICILGNGKDGALGEAISFIDMPKREFWLTPGRNQGTGKEEQDNRLF